MNVLLTYIYFRIDNNSYTSDLTAISTCLVIGVKLGTYQYRGKMYHMSTLKGIVVGRWSIMGKIWST